MPSGQAASSINLYIFLRTEFAFPLVVITHDDGFMISLLSIQNHDEKKGSVVGNSGSGA